MEIWANGRAEQEQSIFPGRNKYRPFPEGIWGLFPSSKCDLGLIQVNCSTSSAGKPGWQICLIWFQSRQIPQLCLGLFNPVNKYITVRIFSTYTSHRSQCYWKTIKLGIYSAPALELWAISSAEAHTQKKLHHFKSVSFYPLPTPEVLLLTDISLFNPFLK